MRIQRKQIVYVFTLIPMSSVAVRLSHDPFLFAFVEVVVIVHHSGSNFVYMYEQRTATKTDFRE